MKVIGSKTSFQNHQPSKLHFVSGADEKRKFCRPAISRLGISHNSNKNNRWFLIAAASKLQCFFCWNSFCHPLRGENVMALSFI